MITWHLFVNLIIPEGHVTFFVIFDSFS